MGRAARKLIERIFNYWRMHKALETLAPKIQKKTPPLMISNQIVYKLKYAIEHFFPPKIFFDLVLFIAPI